MTNHHPGLFHLELALEKFKFSRIDFSDDKEYRNSNLVGCMLFFDPLILNITSFALLKQIHVEVFKCNFADKQFTRVKNKYCLLVSEERVQEEINEYKKKVVNVSENEALAIMNLRNEDDKIVCFVSNIVCRVAEVGKK